MKDSKQQPSQEKSPKKEKGIFYKFLFSLLGLEEDEDENKNEEEMKKEIFDFLGLDYDENENEEEGKKRIIATITIDERGKGKNAIAIAGIMNAAYNLVNSGFSKEERRNFLRDIETLAEATPIGKKMNQAINFFEGLREKPELHKNDEVSQDAVQKLPNQPDDNRWYEDFDIQDGLKKNSQGKEDIHVFGAVPAQHCDLLEQSIKTARGLADKKGRNVLMPFNVNGNHWVGGVMTKIGKDTCFIHNDPMGNEINEALKNELTGKDITIIDLQQRQQKDGDTYNCGVFTVDNLSKFAEAAKNANDLGLTKEEFAENLKIGFESGIEAGQDLRNSQSQEAEIKREKPKSQDDSNIGKNSPKPDKSFVKMIEERREKQRENAANNKGGGRD